jgi:hypothetical protein
MDTHTNGEFLRQRLIIIIINQSSHLDKKEKEVCCHAARTILNFNNIK